MLRCGLFALSLSLFYLSVCSPHYPQLLSAEPVVQDEPAPAQVTPVVAVPEAVEVAKVGPDVTLRVVVIGRRRSW